MAQPKCTILQVHLTPKASSNALVSWDGSTLKVRLNAIPEKGRANEELVDYLSDIFGISKSRIALVRGGKSRLKTLEVDLPLSQVIEVIERQLS